MKSKNLIKIISFAAMVLIAISPVVFSGELSSSDMVIAVEPFLGENFLYGKAYTNGASYYKFEMIKKRKASLLAVGTSRVLQFKNYFFKNDISFYNAGSLAPDINTLVLALQEINPEALPKHLILALDEYFFNEFYYTSVSALDLIHNDDVKTFNLLAIGFVQERIAGKLKFSQLYFPLTSIGVRAKILGQGFDRFGSYIYGNVYNSSQSSEQRVAPTVNDIKANQGRFVKADNISEASKANIASLIAFCKANDIYLTTFTPPLSNSAYDEIKSQQGYGYIDKISEEIGSIIIDAGFEFYNFTNPNTLNITDDYFIDGFHGSDTAYLILLNEMLKQGSKLNNYCTLESNEALLENRISNLQVK